MDFMSIITSLLGGGKPQQQDTQQGPMAGIPAKPQQQAQAPQPGLGDEFMGAPKPGGSNDLLGTIMKLFAGG